MGLASQMIIIILLGTFFGQWLDQRYETSNSYFTAGMGLVSVFVALWFVFKKLLIKK